MRRRDFLGFLGVGAAAGAAGGRLSAGERTGWDLYGSSSFGNVRLLHLTDTHAQLLPMFYREPNVNIGLGVALGRPPHLVGTRLLGHFDLPAGGRRAHAFTHLSFEAAAARFGPMGGYAHLATLIDGLRAEAGEGRSLLLDGGDTWQGSGTAYWTGGRDMVGACNLLGVDLMTGHWEFTYPDVAVLDNLAAFKGTFLAQNIYLREEALFEGFPAFDEDSGRAFQPYAVRELAGVRVAVIGQAFPYTPIANPPRFVPNWSFGIRESELQQTVDRLRREERPDAVVLLSHNGMDVDLKLASRVRGIDVILGGHTHDAMPAPQVVSNAGGRTVVSNAGSNGKFLGVMDLDVKAGRVRDFRYRLLPVFSELLPADPGMQAYIEQVRAPYLDRLREPLAEAGEVLYRRGNFNGTFDQLICDALRKVLDAEIALSPGFRWGTTVLPGRVLSMEDVLGQTCITYPETYVREMRGGELKTMLEAVCDNLFNPDPYLQQGGDMVRVGGMRYACDPGAPIGQRISAMTLDDGTPIEAGRAYRVAGWATVSGVAPGPPVWDVVAAYLRDQDLVRPGVANSPRLLNVATNPGVEDYRGELA